MLYSFLYKLVVLLAVLPVTIVFFCYKRGRHLWWQRFGLWGQNFPSANYVWFHAASAGEVGGLLPVIQELEKQAPLTSILTCTSPTGLNKAAQHFRYKYLLPFDHYLFYTLALNNRLPQLLVITETELWPGLIQYLNKRGVKIVIINARLSSDYQQKLSLISQLIRPAVQLINRFYCQDELTRQRLLALQVSPEKIEVVGNSKFDGLSQYVQGARPAQIYKKTKAVVVLGSLRPGEEEFWLSSFSTYADRIQFVLVPRHLEFVSKLEDRLKRANLECEFWSEYDNSPELPTLSGKLLVIDRIGILLSFYSSADLAFIGGTLLPGYGGHNPLEPVAFNVPILIGPYNANQEGMYQDLIQKQACLAVNSAQEIESAIQKLIDSQDASFDYQIKQASEYLKLQLGAAQTLANAIRKTLI